MKNKIINHLMKKIKENKNNLTTEEYEKIKYGLESIYLSITKLTLIFLIAYILNIFLETLYICLFLNYNRLFSFGLHAKNSITCFITSLIEFIGGAFLAKYILISKLAKIILSSICILLIVIYSPADTEKHPLLKKERRKKLKIISTTMSTILSIFIIIYYKNIITNYMLIGLIESTLMLLPITYKLYGVKYNNYKSYGNI